MRPFVSWTGAGALTIAVAFSPSRGAAQVSLAAVERLWEAERYNEVIEPLSERLRFVRSGEERTWLDYMLVTSLCRSSNPVNRRVGLERLTWMQRRYPRPLPAATFEALREEQIECARALESGWSVRTSWVPVIPPRTGTRAHLSFRNKDLQILRCGNHPLPGWTTLPSSSSGIARPAVYDLSGRAGAMQEIREQLKSAGLTARVDTVGHFVLATTGTQFIG